MCRSLGEMVCGPQDWRVLGSARTMTGFTLVTNMLPPHLQHRQQQTPLAPSCHLAAPTAPSAGQHMTSSRPAQFTAQV